ncbi:MAG: hypothetical protein ACJAXE_000295 [Neolewinella sp.]|jgi:hypothetical protein
MILSQIIHSGTVGTAHGGFVVELTHLTAGAHPDFKAFGVIAQLQGISDGYAPGF